MHDKNCKLAVYSIKCTVRPVHSDIRYIDIRYIDTSIQRYSDTTIFYTKIFNTTIISFQ